MKIILYCLFLPLLILLTSCAVGVTPPSETGNADIVESQNATEEKSTATDKATELDPSVKTFKNPIHNRPSADPFVLYHDGYYYGTFTEASQITIYRGTTIETLFKSEQKKVFEIGGDKEVQGNVWAPEIFYNPATDRWYIYACGSTNGWEFSTIRMFCLESKTDDIFGEYEFKGFTDPDLLAIDQTMFYDETSNTLYTAFSQFTSDGQVIMLAVMDDPYTISDKRIRISHPFYAWESKGERDDKDSRVNEGPIFLEKDGKLCLIYSASGCWSQYYCLGLVEFKGESFGVEEVINEENWEKNRKPIFSAANKVYGVGHCSFFNSPDGSETWIAYHGMPNPDAGEAGRYAYVQKISFDENNLPILGEPLSRATEIPVPAGE